MPVDDPDWKAACAEIGELVLLHSALDSQLNHILIEVLGLQSSAMLEPVVASLDMNRKIEILKRRAKHIDQLNWRKATSDYLELLEVIAGVRNTACHTPLVRNKDGFEFAPAAAGKLLKSIKLDKIKGTAKADRLNLTEIKKAIHWAEKALGSGENLIVNFKRLNAEFARRHGKPRQ
jgi:hypothetical protein